jgi:hypothetical protein
MLDGTGRSRRRPQPRTEQSGRLGHRQSFPRQPRCGHRHARSTTCEWAARRTKRRDGTWLCPGRPCPSGGHAASRICARPVPVQRTAMIDKPVPVKRRATNRGVETGECRVRDTRRRERTRPSSSSTCSLLPPALALARASSGSTSLGPLRQRRLEHLRDRADVLEHASCVRGAFRHRYRPAQPAQQLLQCV